MNSLLIFNPIAGHGKSGGAKEKIDRILRDCLVSCEVASTERAGDGTLLARRAADDGYDLVIAAGGDGTVNEVVNGLAGTNTALGILPLGTVNVLARELRIPLDLRKAAGTIAAGNVKEIDLGSANGRYFTLMAGFGFDAEVVANVLQPMKDWIGASAYVLKGLEMLARYRATEITLEMPEETYSGKAFLVIVANSSTYAYHLKITPHAAPDDGLLDICVFERPITDRIGFMRQVVEAFINRHIYHKAVRYFRAPAVKVTSSPDVMVQLDGDAFGTTPVEVSIAPRLLPIIVPPRA